MKNSPKGTQSRCQFAHKNNRQFGRENFRFTLNLIFKGGKVRSIKMNNFFIRAKLTLALAMGLL